MFDVLTTAALVDQLSNDVQNGRVQQVGMISRHSLWMEIYANRRRQHLIISIEPGGEAVYLQGEEPVFDRQLVTPLLLLLRKYVRGGRIVSIQQPPLERIVRLTIARRLVPPPGSAEPVTVPDVELDSEGEEDDDEAAEDEDVTFVDLVVEIMGRHSNVLLVDNDEQIMESAKRVTAAMSRVRPISPKLPYAAPPPRNGLDPRRLTTAALAPLVESSQHRKVLLHALPAAVSGLSPQIAAEAAHLARLGEADWPVDAGVLAREIRRLFEPLITGAWSPAVYRNEEQEVVAFAAQPLRHLQAVYAENQVSSISDAVRLSIASATASSGKHGVRAQRLAASIESALVRSRSKLAALRAEEERHQNREQLREWGELIYGYLWQISPGDAELVVDGRRIPLDPRLEPKTQARDYLEQYRTGQQSEVQIERVRAATEREVAYLDQLQLLAQQAVAIEDIDDLEREWQARGLSHEKRDSKPRSSGKKRTTPVLTVTGNDIFVGRSGAENDHVTFEIAGQDDTWLHARRVPGSHVIVRWGSREREDEATLMRAAEIAAFFSKSRSSGRVEVDITARRFVRKIKGGGPGLVTYQNERTVSVRPVGPD